jgi:PhnB protein
MTTIFQTHYEKDFDQKKVFVQRTFDAPLELVWRAWTEKEILDQWWAPRPWQTKTKSIDFKTGGHWLYSMVGPNNEEHWSKADYVLVEPMKAFHGLDVFCDANGIAVEGMPQNDWKVNFSAVENQTLVKVELTFPTIEQMEMLIKMGFEGGFAMAHTNLDEVLKTLK